MSDYIYKYLVVHSVCASIGLSTTLINDREVCVRDILLAFIFGPFYMLHEFSDLDAVVLRLPEKKK